MSSLLTRIDLLFIVLATVTIGIIGFVIFLNNRNSATNRSFLYFTLVTIFWGGVNYASYQTASPTLALWLVRLVLFFAVWQAFYLFRLFYVFPKAGLELSRRLRLILYGVVVLTSFFALTPFVFSDIKTLSLTERAPSPVVEPGIALFAIVSVGLIVAGVVSLIRSMRASDKEHRAQFWYIGIGAFLMFLLIVIFNLFLPVFLLNSSFIPFAPVFIFPFIALTAYAIFKHHLFDVKVIATELVVFFLVLVLFVQFLNAETLLQIIISAAVFVSTVGMGLFLIQSVLKEVTQREQIENLNVQLQKSIEELHKVDELKTEFVSLASHQLRTPLTAIKGFVDMLRNGDFGGLNEGQKEAADKVFQSSQRMVDLIDDLLDVSKLEREGGFVYKFQIANPEEFARTMVEEFQPRAKERGLTLTFDASISEETRLKFDKEKLDEALGNLISNAIKYTPQGSIDVSLSEGGETILFAVKDSGVGVDPEDIPKLFQKFFRTKTVQETSTEGTGLGLYFTRSVVMDHGGHIWVESEGVGKGSQFYVKLPKVKGDNIVLPGELNHAEKEEEAKPAENRAPKEGEEAATDVAAVMEKEEEMRKMHQEKARGETEESRKKEQK